MMLKSLASDSHSLGGRRLPMRARFLPLNAATAPRDYGGVGLDGIPSPHLRGSEIRSPVRTKFFTNFFAAHGGGTYIHVGTDFALETLAIAENAAVSCLAFEADPVAFIQFDDAARKKARHGNIELFNIELHNASGMLSREYDDARDLAPLSDADGEMDRSPQTLIQIRVDRLDSVVGTGQLRLPLAARIAAPGREARILAGGQLTLSQAAMLAVELGGEAAGNPEDDAAFVADFVSQHFASAALLKCGTNAVPVWHPAETIAKKISAPPAARSNDQDRFCVLAYKGTGSGPTHADL